MAKLMAITTTALGMLLSSALIHAEILTYTESTNSNNELALGYQVPIPVASMTAINGFRSYDTLRAQHLSLALNNVEVESFQVGTSHHGREILAYRFGDQDNQTHEGEVEPAFLVNGTIHAREWQSPEVVTELMERLVEGKNDQSMIEYLLDNTNIIILPVSNVDGFLQTQRYPTNVTNSPSTSVTSSPIDKFAQPRDGRMRRKNMPSVDELLTTDIDRLSGVDLNRNSSHFFAVQPDNSVPDSLIYGGSSAFSEPETQALLEAAKLGPESELRFYQDSHSFSRVLFIPQPNNARRNLITNNLATKFQNTTINQGANYFPVIGTVNQGIATTADYFAYQFLIPTWTLEIEPPQGFQGEPDGGAFYGGTGASHSGFIAPDTAIARIRDQLAPAQLLMFYHQAGPAHVKSVRIADASNQLVYSADWQKSGTSRSLDVTNQQTLIGGQEYQLWVQFSKPMRWRNNDSLAQYPGQSVSLAPNLSWSGTANNSNFTRNINSAATSWQNQTGGELSGYGRYKDDSILLSFVVPSDVTVASSNGNTNFRLNINVQDFAGLSLDARPATAVDWLNGAWSGYEDSNGQQSDSGGADSSYVIAVANSSLRLAPVDNSSSSDGGGGSTNFLVLLGLLALLGIRSNRKPVDTRKGL